MNIADRIQHLRKMRGISQEELADKIGVSRQAVSKWESEQSTPDVEKIIIMSDYFEVTTDYLLKGIEPAEVCEQRLDAMIFSIVGTAINIIGLIVAISIWIERQVVYAVGIGLIMMAIGTVCFIIGQVSRSRNKVKAKASFSFVNIWVLLLIPTSSCFNLLDGLFGGYSGRLSPIPLMGNSLITYGLYWLFYLAVCVIADVLIMKKARRTKQS